MGDTDIARAAQARSATPFLDTSQAAHYLGLSARHLARMRGRGEGPPHRQHSRYVRYHVDDLITWSESTRGPAAHA